MKTVSLTTDFGTGDFEIGSMCGVILNIAPETNIVDLTHEIPPQDVIDAAVVLSRHFFYFSPGSIHIVVVDPGVGTSRNPIAALIKDQFYVGPDNGIITLVYQRAIKNGWPVKIIHTNKPEFWLPNISNIFHGRDIFAAVAGHLSSGVALESLGEEIHDPVLLDFPEPVMIPGGIRGSVMRIDHFGNLESNIDQALIKDPRRTLVKCNGQEINGLVDTFGNAKDGDLVSMIDSSGQLSICTVNGSAAMSLDAKVGTKIEVIEIDSAK